MLFSLAEIKIIDGVSKESTNQNRALLYREIFIFFDINQSELSFNGHGMFNKFKVNQSEFPAFVQIIDKERYLFPFPVIFTKNI